MNAARLLLPLACILPAFAEPAITERVTSEQLAAQTQESPFLALKQPKTPDEAKVKNSAGESILGNSDILTDGTHWTLVPKGAVLHTPAALATKVGATPQGSLLPWAEFLNVNRGWISTEEVTYDQATGKNPLQADHAAFWPKQGKVIIAVHQGGPISVRSAATPAQASR